MIEVLKGPASAMYGFNAFDGVINIITKSPEEMKGTTLQFGGGEQGTISSAAVQAGNHRKVRLSIGDRPRPVATMAGSGRPGIPLSQIQRTDGICGLIQRQTHSFRRSDGNQPLRRAGRRSDQQFHRPSFSYANAIYEEGAFSDSEHGGPYTDHATINPSPNWPTFSA